MLAPLIELLSTSLEQLILTTGIIGIVVIAFMENIFPLTPSEFLYPLAGKLAYEGQLNLITVMVAGGVGSIIGAFIFYHVGYYLGADRARNLIDQYGTVKIWRWQIALFTVKTYDDAMASFDKHGGLIVMIARTMPLIHGVISIPAGVNQMNLVKFMVYSFIGALLWIVPTVLFGYFLGSQWDLMLSYINTYETIWYIVLGLLIAYWIVQRWRKSHSPEKETQ